MGGLYVADTDNNRVLRVTAGGALELVAGIPFHQPRGLVVDRAGFLYVADTGNGFIRRVDTKGIIRSIAGNGRVTPMGMAPPTPDVPGSEISLLLYGLAFDRAGNFYFTDANRVRRLLPDGWVSTVVGNGTRGVGGDGGGVEVRSGRVVGRFEERIRARGSTGPVGSTARRVIPMDVQ